MHELKTSLESVIKIHKSTLWAKNAGLSMFKWDRKVSLQP